MSDTRGSSSSIGSGLNGLMPLPELSEAAVAKEDGAQDDEDNEDDVWSDAPAVDAEEDNTEVVTHEDSKDSDMLIPEPAGLESEFRFDLNDMKVDKILGTALNAVDQFYLMLRYIHYGFV